MLETKFLVEVECLYRGGELVVLPRSYVDDRGVEVSRSLGGKLKSDLTIMLFISLSSLLILLTNVCGQNMCQKELV